MHYPYEIRSDEAVFEEIPEMKLPDQMIGLAEDIIDKMSGEFEPDKFEDRYENAMIELIRSKQAGLPAPKEKARGAAGERRQSHGCAAPEHRGHAAGKRRPRSRQASARLLKRSAGKEAQEGWLMAAAARRPGVRRRIEFDAETWYALHRLSLDSMKSLQDLADELPNSPLSASAAKATQLEVMARKGSILLRGRGRISNEKPRHVAREAGLIITSDLCPATPGS